jgi:hypothetical protein
MTALSWAARKGHESTVRLLLDRSVNINAMRGFYYMTALHRAANNGRESTVQLLLDRGADINAKDIEGMTALSWAVENGHKSTVRLLFNCAPTSMPRIPKE